MIALLTLLVIFQPYQTSDFLDRNEAGQPATSMVLAAGCLHTVQNQSRSSSRSLLHIFTPYKVAKLRITVTEGCLLKGSPCAKPIRS